MGKQRIGALLADREFIGQDWFNYLLQAKIHFYIRVPKSYRFEVNGMSLKAESLLSSRVRCKIDNVSVLGIKGLSVEMMKTKNKKGADDYLIVLTNTLACQALKSYRKRWRIEAMFQDFKKQGFHLENTHLKAPCKIVKLLYLVSVAYCFCVHMGLLYEKEEGGIPRKKHGYRAYSVFRIGLDLLRTILHRKSDRALELWNRLIDKFTHFMLLKMLKNNKL